VPTQWSSSLIFGEFTMEPQTAEQIHSVLVDRFGSFLPIPPLRTVQAALSAHGEKKGGMRVRKGNQVLWVCAPTDSAPTANSAKQHKRPLTLSSKKKAEQAKREKSADSKASLRQRASELLLHPLSPFMVFGFSQRGILKKQKEPIRDVVKAVGERWLLLSDTERARYEAMAEEDQRRAASAALRTPTAADDADDPDDARDLLLKEDAPAEVAMDESAVHGDNANTNGA